MHPAIAQQMVMKKVPEPEDPTIGEYALACWPLLIADLVCAIFSRDGRAQCKGYRSRTLSQTAWMDERNIQRGLFRFVVPFTQLSRN